MGKSRSYEVVEYRKSIQNKLCRDPEILKLLDEQSNEHPEDTIPFNKVYPHEYIPDTITETKRIICFDMRADIDSRNKTLKELTIYFFISCHQDVVQYFENGRMFLWYDKVVCALDELFSDQNKLGIGKMQLEENTPYYPQQKFKGRQLTFKVFDFYNGRKYGK